MKGTLIIVVVLIAIATKIRPAEAAKHVHVIDPVYCKGKADGNYVHPADCTRFVSCANNNASEKNCPPCNHEMDEVRCLSAGRLVYSEAKDTCLWADETECKNGGDSESDHPSTEPSTATHRPPGPDDPGLAVSGSAKVSIGGGGGGGGGGGANGSAGAHGSGGEKGFGIQSASEGKPCDPEKCKMEGFCLHFYKCDPKNKTWVEEKCGAGLLWNPNGPNGTKQIDGGKCGDPHHLDKETLDAYRKDPNCLECHWDEYKECSAKYLYQPPDLFYPHETELECDAGLIFSKLKGTCIPCHEAKSKDGKPCC